MTVLDSNVRARVLVVEDDELLRDGLVDMLTEAGWEVAACADGLEALTRLRAAPDVDLIVLDLHMPHMDGWQFRAAQKRDPALASTPVLVLSADDGPQAQSIDAELVLKKPFDPDALIRSVEALVAAPSTRPSEVRAAARAERLASLGTLAAGVAHEINNPLACVIGRLELVKMCDGHVDVEALEDMLEASYRIRDIVRDIQTFARTDDADGTPGDVHGALEAALRLVAHEVRPRARLVRDYEPTPLVAVSSGRLAQVFVNLLVNAAHAIGEGRADANTIRATLRTDDRGWAVAAISDTGCGIAPSLVGRIFDPFFTTKPPGSGTGLGLSICHGIVTAVGGTIEAESEVGAGSAFRLRLPPAASLAPRAARPAVAAAKPSARRRRLLVIEDEEKLGKLVATALESTGRYEVTTMTKGERALALIEHDDRFDAIICDLMMPDLTGMDLHREIARRSSVLARKMVFVTGGAFTPRSKEFLASIANPSLPKPFRIEELERALASVFDDGSDRAG